MDKLPPLTPTGQSHTPPATSSSSGVTSAPVTQSRKRKDHVDVPPSRPLAPSGTGVASGKRVRQEDAPPSLAPETHAPGDVTRTPTTAMTPMEARASLERILGATEGMTPDRVKAEADRLLSLPQWELHFQRDSSGGLRHHLAIAAALEDCHRASGSKFFFYSIRISGTAILELPHIVAVLNEKFPAMQMMTVDVQETLEPPVESLDLAPLKHTGMRITIAGQADGLTIRARQGASIRASWSDKPRLLPSRVIYVGADGREGAPRPLHGLLHYCDPEDLRAMLETDGEHAPAREFQRQVTDVNLNGEVTSNSANVPGQAPARIVCGHLSVQWLMDRSPDDHRGSLLAAFVKSFSHEAVAPFSYRHFATPSAVQQHVGLAAFAGHQFICEYPMHRAALFDGPGFGSMIAQQFGRMSPGEKACFFIRMPAYHEKTGHAMTCEFQVDEFGSGDDVQRDYHFSLYDPNQTMTELEMTDDAPERFTACSYGQWLAEKYLAGEPAELCSWPLPRRQEPGDAAPAVGSNRLWIHASDETLTKCTDDREMDDRTLSIIRAELRSSPSRFAQARRTFMGDCFAASGDDVMQGFVHAVAGCENLSAQQKVALLTLPTSALKEGEDAFLVYSSALADIPEADLAWESKRELLRLACISCAEKHAFSPPPETRNRLLHAYVQGVLASKVLNASQKRELVLCTVKERSAARLAMEAGNPVAFVAMCAAIDESGLPPTEKDALAKELFDTLGLSPAAFSKTVDSLEPSLRKDATHWSTRSNSARQKSASQVPASQEEQPLKRGEAERALAQSLVLVLSQPRFAHLKVDAAEAARALRGCLMPMPDGLRVVLDFEALPPEQHKLVAALPWKAWRALESYCAAGGSTIVAVNFPEGSVPEGRGILNLWFTCDGLNQLPSLRNLQWPATAHELNFGGLLNNSGNLRIQITGRKGAMLMTVQKGVSVRLQDDSRGAAIKYVDEGGVGDGLMRRYKSDAQEESAREKSSTGTQSTREPVKPQPPLSAPGPSTLAPPYASASAPVTTTTGPLQPIPDPDSLLAVGHVAVSLSSDPLFGNKCRAAGLEANQFIGGLDRNGRPQGNMRCSSATRLPELDEFQTSAPEDTKRSERSRFFYTIPLYRLRANPAS